jgi:hypothetical protein
MMSRRNNGRSFGKSDEQYLHASVFDPSYHYSVEFEDPADSGYSTLA